MFEDHGSLVKLPKELECIVKDEVNFDWQSQNFGRFNGSHLKLMLKS